MVESEEAIATRDGRGATCNVCRGVVVMNLNDMMTEISAGLRDVIRETPEVYLKEDPEDAYADLAARLIFRLSEKLTIGPVEVAKDVTIERMMADSAQRIFDVLTNWMLAGTRRSFTGEVNHSGKFEIVLRDAGTLRGYFQGGAVQDALAQATQTLIVEETP